MASGDKPGISLVLLAAGVGSRYGKLKQLEQVGPGSNTIADYTIFDAMRAGIDRVVFVIRPETEEAFRRQFDRTIERHSEVAYCHQCRSVGNSGTGCQVQSWGTGHAVLAAADAVDGAFVVANADDLYGQAALGAAYDYLARDDGSEVPTHAIVAYSLAGTLSDSGPVSRAICQCDADAGLRDIVEIDGIERHGQSGRYIDDRGTSHLISGDALVSMNLWAFRPAVFKQLGECSKANVCQASESARSEFRLPTAVSGLVRSGRARVKVLRAGGRWCGLTYRQDKTHVDEHIRLLIKAGAYPEVLWS